MQHGHGSGILDLWGAENNSRLTIISEIVRSYKRFNLTGREICVKLKKPPTDENDIETWFENCMKELHDLVIKDSLPNDYIGFEIRSEKLNKPLWLSFRPAARFNLYDIITLIESVAQSSTSFDINDGGLNILTAIVRVPSGRGRVPLTSLSLFDVNKRSILRIKGDKSCFSRSLCTALVHAKRGQLRSGVLHENWKKIRKGGNLQKLAAKQLERDAGVNIPDAGCGLNEIHQFQIYLAHQGVCIVVYDDVNFGKGELPIYDGKRYVLDSDSEIFYILRDRKSVV